MTHNSVITIVIKNCRNRLLFFNGTYKRSQRAGICVLVESLLPLSTILILIFDFGLVPTVSFDSPFERTGNCLETYDLTISVYFIIAPKRL
jgi:hypothetical protein